MDATIELSMAAEPEEATSGNSFYDARYFGTRILIMAEKPGDEILLAGNTILNMAAAKAEIIVAYLKKGKIPELGLKKIIFIEGDAAKTALEVAADIIIYAENEAFEKAVAEVLRHYKPEVYKKPILKNQPADFYAANIISTQQPQGVANWEKRVRFPAALQCQKTLLKDNPLAKALAKEIDATKVLNGDEIFFEVESGARRQIQPFIKLTESGNFFYALYLPYEVEQIKLGVYRFHVEEEIGIKAEADGEVIFSEVLEGETVLNLGESEEIVLTAMAAGTNIYDRAIIKRVGDFEQLQYKMRQIFDAIGYQI